MEDWQAERVGRRLARNFRVGKGECVPFYVAALGIDRCYGGPEEGGWWYDTTTILKVYKVFDWKQALVRCKELQEEYPTCPRGRYSVIGGQDTYVRTFRSLEDLPEEDYSRPRYE
jgi:hypothetical protein